MLSKNQIIKYSLLNEIDYGEIEGKSLNYIQQNYNNIILAWSKGLDIKFPKGENYKNVINRLKTFEKILIKDNSPKENILVVTHNVILRVLLGMYLDIRMNKWHKLKIPHLGYLNLLFLKIKFILKLIERIYKSNL